MSFFSRKKDKKEEEQKEAPAAPAKKEAPAPAENKSEAEETVTDSSDKTKTWHITKRSKDGMWQVKGEGNDRATKLFRTKAEAEEYVKTLLANNKGSKVIAHKKDGHFQKK